MKKLHYVLASLFICAVSHAGLISHIDYTAGNVITAAGQNTNENAIVNEFNGNITAANLTDNTITGAKLLTGTITSAKLADASVTFAKLGNGSLGVSSMVFVTSAYTLTTTADVVVSSNPTVNTSYALTLPTAVSNRGKIFTLVMASQNLGGSVIITPNGSETIAGATTKRLFTPNEVWTIVSDGTNWQVLVHKSSTEWVTYSPTYSAGWGTTSNSTVRFRRVGDTVYVHGVVQLGTVAASSGTITLPSGINLDITKIAQSGRGYAGQIFTLNSAASPMYANNKVAVLAADSDNPIKVYMAYQVESNIFKVDNVSSWATSSGFVSFDFNVPVENWAD